MYFKILLVATTVVIASAQLDSYGQDRNHGRYNAYSSASNTHHPNHAEHVPVTAHHSSHDSTHSHQDYNAPAHYAFEYSVQDSHTGDIKSQHETREGDVVHGYYSLHEADGTVRRVEYTVDKHSGFNAVVHRKGHAQHTTSANH